MKGVRCVSVVVVVVVCNSQYVSHHRRVFRTEEFVFSGFIFSGFLSHSRQRTQEQLLRE